jgi:beta-1,4-N-acetylglucosaminyltransferase
MYSFFFTMSKKSTLIVLGSGGHTTEMLRLVDSLDQEIYQPRTYVMATTDNTSMDKLSDGEKLLSCTLRIPRAREVHQSWITSFFYTCIAFFSCIPLVWKIKPRLLLLNGPGTCVPICFIVWLFNLFYFFETKMVYVESICRVESLSMSAKICSYFCDEFLVQWQELADKYPSAKYIGKLT